VAAHATQQDMHAGLRIEFEAVADALRQGTRGAVRKAAMTKRPLPFLLSDIKTPVYLWHGARDTNAPIAIAAATRANCRTPRCTSATRQVTISATTAATRSRP